MRYIEFHIHVVWPFGDREESPLTDVVFQTEAIIVKDAFQLKGVLFWN